MQARRKPGGGKRREQAYCQIASFTPRVTKHGFSGSPAVRHFFWSEPSLTKCFSRDTNHERRITAFFRVLRPSGGEKCRLADQDDFGEVTVEVDAISAVQGMDPDALLQAGIGEVGGIVEKLSVRVLEESA